MKLKDLKLNQKAVDVLSNKLSKIKLPDINIQLNNYKINYHNLSIKLPKNTRYELLKNEFNITQDVNDFNIFWNKNIFKLEKYYSFLRKLEKY